MANTVLMGGDIGVRFDLAVRKGQPLTEHEVTLYQDEAMTLPLDLTGWTFKAYARTRETVPVLRAMSFAVDAPATGVVRFWMDAATTALLPGPLYVTSAPEVCDWALTAVQPDLTEFVVFYGEFEVSGDVPKP